MQREILCRPFSPEQVKQREGQGGKKLSYVEAHAVIARLNEGCDAWSFEIVERQILEEEVVVVAKLTADGLVKMAFGGATITRDRVGRAVSIADDLKAAGSDALKKAASLLGVGLGFYGAGPDSGERPQPRGRPGAPPGPPQDDRATDRQLSAIQSVVRRQNLGAARLVAMLEARFRKVELGDLSRQEASTLLSELSHSTVRP